MNVTSKKSAATFDLSSSGPLLPNDTSTCLIQVREFFAPHSIANVQDSFNLLSFQLYLSDLTLAHSLSLSIPAGGYDINSLLSALNTNLDTQMKTYYTASNITFTSVSLAFDSTTGKVTWGCTMSPSLVAMTNPITTLIATPCPLLEKLGFSSSSSGELFLQGTKSGYGIETSFPSGTILHQSTSSQLVNLSYPNAIYVTIDNIRANNVYAGTGLDILDVLPIAGDFVFGDYIHIQHNSPFRQEVPHAQLKGSVTVRLWDENQNELDFQGQDWTLMLGIEWGLDTHASGLETSKITEIRRPPLFRVPGYDSLHHYQYHPGGKRM